MRLHEFSIVVLQWLWQTTWQAALLAAVIGCTTGLGRRWISPGARQALWLLVFLRLMMPFLPASRFSIWGLYTQPETKSDKIAVQTVHYSNAQWPAMTDRTDNHSFVAPPPPSIFEYPQTWLAILWAAGAMLVFGYTIVSTFRFASAVRRTARQPDETTAGLIKECLVLSPRPVLWERVRVRVLPRILKTALNRDRTLTPALSRNTGRGGEKGAHPMLCVIVTDKVATPALFGVFRPMLLLPLRITSTLDSQALRNVILHELEHLKRHHLAMDWLLTAIRAVHWFNPAAWWAHRQIRAAREFICDQAVIAGLSDRNAPQHYGNTLLTIAGGALRSHEPALVAAFARDQKLLRERIETIARFGKVKYIAGLGILLLVVVAAVFLTSPRKNNPVKPSDTAKTVADLTSQAKELTTQGRYENAVAVLHQILQLDPDNDYATSVLPLVTDREIIQEQQKYRQRVGRGGGLQEVLKKPDNWPQLPTTRPNDQAVYAALDRKLPEVRLNNVAFTDVVEFLRDVSGTNIYVNWQAIEQAGFNRNALISAEMRDIKFSKVLEIILLDLDGKGAKLKYAVDQGVIVISTEEDLASNVITRVYDIRDLVAAGNADQKQRQELISQMIKFIEETIAADSWKDHGGKTGTIRELPGSAQLIVTQTPENHRKLAALLDQLRETRAIQIRVDAQILEVPAKEAAELEQHFTKDTNLFLEDQTVSEMAGAPGVRVVGKPALTSLNGQEVVFDIGGERESVSFRYQATISQDRKSVTMAPSMIYSPNSALSAVEQMQLTQALNEYTSAKIETIEARTQYGANHPIVAAAEQREQANYSKWQDAVKPAIQRQAAATKPPEEWILSTDRPVVVPVGANLVVKNYKHSITQTKPDGTTEEVVAPSGDKVIWLLVRPTIILQREKEQEQFPLLQK